MPPGPPVSTPLLRKDHVLRKQYAVAVQNKFEILEQVTTAEEKWSQLKVCIQDALEEHVPKRPKKEHKKWMTQNVLDLMDER